MEEFAQVKKQFLDLLLRKHALKIARSESEFFVFKSGRRSPNFINIGALSDGESQALLKKAYASAIKYGLENGLLNDFDFIFGPAYKGITLAALAAEGLYEFYNKNSFVLYDRKEAKAYGDVNADQIIIGAGAWKNGASILLVDDVITTGKAKYDALEKMKVLDGFKLAGMVLAVDRQELMGAPRWPAKIDDSHLLRPDGAGDATLVGDKSAVQAMEKELGIKTVAILTMQEIFDAVKQSLSPEVRKAWVDYYEKYGAVKLG